MSDIITKDELTKMMIQRYLGTPYIFGGNNLMIGVDCSAWVLNLLWARGEFPYGQDTNAKGLYDHYVKLGAHATVAAGFGDLVFYGPDYTGISHVAFAVSATHLVEAGHGDSSCRSVSDAMKRGACVRFMPIKYRKDLIGIVRIADLF